MAHNGQISGGVIDPRPAVILVKGGVEHPMELILNAPMAANGMRKLAGIRGQTGQKQARLGGFGAVAHHR